VAPIRLDEWHPFAYLEWWLRSKAEVDQLIDEWRRGYGAVAADGTSPAAELRRLLWEPLAPKLEGVQTVLISPEGQTAMLPWGALPGSEPGTYLLHETAIAMVPVPRMLPELLADTGSTDDQHRQMLLVGGVDFNQMDLAPAIAAAQGISTDPAGEPASDAEPGTEDGDHRIAMAGSSQTLTRSRTAIRSDRATAYQPLPATQREIETIRELLQHTEQGELSVGVTAVELTGAEATKTRFLQLAPYSRYLHLATHGFFAPEDVKSALARSDTDTDRMMTSGQETRVVGFHPGLLSGIVFAGANRAATQPTDIEPPTVALATDDNSILTAIEVAEMNLRGVQLAVLSACDTGLGQVAGGEGVLGLQRAFQTAGARTTVTSLWQVDDPATSPAHSPYYWAAFVLAGACR